MNRYLIIAVWTLFSMPLWAQTEYNFSVLENVYEPVVGGDTLSKGLPWTEEDFLFTTPFEVDLFGIRSTRFRAMQGAIRADTNINDEAMNIVAAAFAADLTSRAANAASSPIILKTEGTDGMRVVTLEYRNAFFEILDGAQDYVSFQIKYFERDRSIEFHYGPSSTARVERTMDEQNLIFGGLVGLALGDSTEIIEAYLLSGLAENPMVVRINEILQGFPESGVIYRFSPKTTITVDHTTEVCDAISTWIYGPKYNDLDFGEEAMIFDISGHLRLKGRSLSSNEWSNSLSRGTPEVLILKSPSCPSAIKFVTR